MDSRDRYRIVGALGEGGVAEVFDAVAVGEHGFERRVAIKRLRAQLAEDDTFVKSFVDEARIASQLHHANIVGVFDFGIMDGAPFQVIELVEGVDARVVLDQLRIPLDLALYIALQVARALSYAHDAAGSDGEALAIVHRDVKPKNILISWNGDVKLADFGIAFARNRLQATEVGFAKGTLPYMSPEQAAGGAVDRRADVFALGCLVHALITGSSPVGTEINDRRPKISPDLPDDVQGIVERATRYARHERYEDADHMAEDLSRALAEHGGGDPRTALKKLVEPLKPKRAAPPSRAAMMLDVALILEGTDRPVRRFSTIAPPLSEPEIPPTLIKEPESSPTLIREPTLILEEKTKATVLAPAPPTPRKTAPWKLGAWFIVITLLTANLVVMLMSRPTEVILVDRPSAPVPVPVPVPVPISDPIAPEDPAVHSDAVPAPVPAPAPAPAPKKTKRSPAAIDPAPAEPRSQPTRDSVRADLLRLRTRLARLGSALPPALETRFLDLSEREARGADDDLSELATATRALEAEVARIEANLRAP